MYVVKAQCRWYVAILFLSLFLCSCASSNVSRTAARNVDLGRENVAGLGEGGQDVAGYYQNMSQTSKGALLGGVTGGTAGWLLGSSVGVVPGAITGALLGASYGAYTDSETTLKDKLENRGAIVVVLGDQIRIVFPSVRLFEERCATLKSGAYSTLALTAQYINRFVKMLVKVSVYTNDDVSQASNLLLSRQQANKVADVLLANGIDARLLYAVGYGNRHFVENTNLSWDKSLNYRVEITLEKLYV